MFQLSNESLHALKYFGLYLFAFRMGTGPAWAAFAIHRCSEIDWTETTLQYRSVWHNFENDKAFQLREEVVPTNKLAGGAIATSTSVNLPVIAVVYVEGASGVSVERAQRDYDEYLAVCSGSNEISRDVGAGGVSLEESLEDVLL